MKENKYYTPEIEEFHVGFEYEYYYKNEWHKHNLDGSPIIHHELDEFDDDLMKLVHAICRVKYLDQEDIESLGFEYLGETGINERLDFLKRKQFKNKNHRLQWFKNGNVMISSNNNDLEDEFKGHPDRLRFEGTIKNKSELKIILKQIGYEG